MYCWWLFYRTDTEAFMPRYWKRVQQLLFILVRGIPPSKSDLAIGEGDETMVGMATRWVWRPSYYHRRGA